MGASGGGEEEVEATKGEGGGCEAERANSEMEERYFIKSWGWRSGQLSLQAVGVLTQRDVCGLCPGTDPLLMCVWALSGDISLAWSRNVPFLCGRGV